MDSTGARRCTIELSLAKTIYAFVARILLPFPASTGYSANEMLFVEFVLRTVSVPASPPLATGYSHTQADMRAIYDRQTFAS